MSRIRFLRKGAALAHNTLWSTSVTSVQNFQIGSNHFLHANNDIQGRREFHCSPPRQSALVVGGLVILGTVVVGEYTYQQYAAYRAAKAKEAAEAPPEEDAADEAKANMKSESTSQTREEKAKAKGKEKEKKQKSAEGATPGWMDQWFAKRFYDGGFEEKMTKREAALILGVRESSDSTKVKAAHRRILLLNHPDMGGSVFIATKVNEAKDLLLKGRE